MYCGKCGNFDTKVLDSRSSEDGKSIKRRRECSNCQNRFTTYEKIAVNNLIVVKSGDIKERYDRNKLEDSILTAANKRWISIAKIEWLIGLLETQWWSRTEISSREIGEGVLEKLKEIDEISYIRYASVYHNFESASDFLDFIKS